MSGTRPSDRYLEMRDFTSAFRAMRREEARERRLSSSPPSTTSASSSASSSPSSSSTPSSTSSSSSRSKLFCLTPSLSCEPQKETTTKCLLCTAPLPKIETGAGEEEEEEERERGRGRERGREEGGRVPEREETNDGLCENCHAKYIQSQVVVRLHGAISTALKEHRQVVQSLERVAKVLTSTEIIDFGADFLAAVDLHHQCEETLALAEDVVRRLGQMTGRSAGERELLANLRRCWQQRVQESSLRFRIVSCDVRKLRMLQAERVYLRLVAVVGLLRSHEQVWELLNSRLEDLVATFKHDLALQLVMKEAQISWKSYAQQLKAKADLHAGDRPAASARLLGVADVASAFEGTVLRKTRRFFEDMYASMQGKHLESFLQNTFQKLAALIAFLEQTTPDSFS